MKSLIFTTLVIFTIFLDSSFADSVKVEISPSSPVTGEVFQAIFRVFTDADEEPSINFSPYKLEVVGKSNQGIKTSTVYANGQFSSSREMTIVYDLVSSSYGSAGLRDITIQFGNKTIRHPSVSFNVLKEPKVAADVFVMADVPKTTLFLGEGIIVRYYLYHKAPVRNVDIKKYPKLNGFLKRFLQEPERSERVSVDGELYIRTQLYSAKLFAEKVGELRVDPMQLTATVISSSANDPFSAFGFGGGTPRQRNISSDSVKVEVRPLPEAGKPDHFIGLVGKHSIDLQTGNSRLIVNEPLELKLTITGNGALENLEAPEILKHQDLEEFETNGDLKIMSADQATKVFDYTFLPKTNLNIPAKSVTLSYFDPESMRYIPVEVSMPEIVVAGSPDKNSIKKSTNEKELNQPQDPSKPFLIPKLGSPIISKFLSWRSWLIYLNSFLAVLAFLVALGLVVRRDKLPKFSNSSVPVEFRKGMFELGIFVKWLTPLITKTGKSPLSIIRDSNLSSEAKSYFIDLLQSYDYKDFSAHKGQFKFRYDPKSFKELDRYIQSRTHEDSSQPA